MGIWEWFKDLVSRFLDWFLGSDEPETPDLSTEELVREYLEEAFGLTMDEENDIFQTSIPYQSELNEYGYYGAPVSTLIDDVPMIIGMIAMAECQVVDEYQDVPDADTEEKCAKRVFGKWKDGKCIMPKSGHFKFRFEFDPNNGFIYLFWVHPDYLRDDIKDLLVTERRPMSENPDYEKYLQPKLERA